MITNVIDIYIQARQRHSHLGYGFFWSMKIATLKQLVKLLTPKKSDDIEDSIEDLEEEVKELPSRLLGLEIRVDESLLIGEVILRHQKHSQELGKICISEENTA